VSLDHLDEQAGGGDYESASLAFIVRIWLEETVQETGTATWRGHITHVPSGERRYLKDLQEIVAFIAPYLQRMGVQIPRRWELSRPLQGWRVRLWRR